MFQKTSSSAESFEVHSSTEGLEDGQLSLSLQVSSMNIPLGGVYSCVATNSMGTRVSQKILLDIEYMSL